VPAEWLQGAIRFSLSELNTAEEISFVNEKVPLVVQRLQGLSALGKLASHEHGKTAGAGAGPGIVARG